MKLGDAGTPTIRLMPTESRPTARRGIQVPAFEKARAAVVAPSAIINLYEAEPRGLYMFRRVLRAAVLVGMMTAAWQASAVIGRF